MATRGRKSAASLTVVSSNTQIVKRPPAPTELTDEEAEVWRSVVADEPADWFHRRGTHGLLVEYCRAKIDARRVSQLIESYIGNDDPDAFLVAEYHRLLRMRDLVAGRISSLLTKMRISHQATYDAKTKKSSSVKRPWDAN